MLRQDSARFGLPLPIELTGIRSVLDRLHPADRYEAVAAAMPVYRRMERLQRRIAEHRGWAFITATGWLREGRFAFFFELDCDQLRIVDLVVEPVPPDDPDGVYAFLVHLRDRVRYRVVVVPSNGASPTGTGVSARPEVHEADDHSPLAASGIEASASGRQHGKPVDLGEDRPSPSGRAAIVGSPSDLLVMAGAAAAIVRTGVPSTPPRQAVEPIRSGVALGVARALLRLTGSLISVAAVRTAERLSRGAAVARRTASRPRTYREMIQDGGAHRESRALDVPPAKGRLLDRMTRVDGLQARVVLDDARLRLSQVLASHQLLLADGDELAPGRFRATLADLVSAPPRAFAWSEDDPAVDQDTVELPTSNDAYVLSQGRPSAEEERPAFFGRDERKGRTSDVEGMA